MIERTEQKEYKTGDTIYREGDFEDCIYFIESGAVELSKTIKGYKVIVEVVSAGDVFGEYGFITKVPRIATAKAVMPTTLRIIESAFFLEEYQKLSEGFKKIISTIAVRLLTRTNKVVKSKLPRSSYRMERQVQIKYQAKNKITEGVTKNISSNGVFIPTDKPLAIGTVFDLDLFLEDFLEPFTVKCEVVWQKKRKKTSPSAPNGMGVKFVRIARKNHSIIKDMCQYPSRFNWMTETIPSEFGTIKLEIVSHEKSIYPPIFFAPGFSTTLRNTCQFRKELAKNGYPVISLQYPRNWYRMDLARVTLSRERLRPAVLKTVFQYLEETGHQNMVVIGHSCGAVDLSEVIEKNDFALIKTIILANPAGMTVGLEKGIMPSKVWKMGRNFFEYSANTIREVAYYAPREPLNSAKRIQWILGHVLDMSKNPIEASKDMLSITQANIVTSLLNIKKKGINSILYINKDRLFPLKEVLENANKGQIPVAVYSGKGKTHHDVIMNYTETVPYIIDLIKFQEIVDALSDKFPNTNIVDAMKQTELFDLDVIFPGN